MYKYLHVGNKPYIDFVIGNDKEILYLFSGDWDDFDNYYKKAYKYDEIQDDYIPVDKKFKIVYDESYNIIGFNELHREVIA